MRSVTHAVLTQVRNLVLRQHILMPDDSKIKPGPIFEVDHEDDESFDEHCFIFIDPDTGYRYSVVVMGEV